MPSAVDRFAGIAAAYDAARPHPPAELADVLRQWSGAGAPDVVDVGAGTGLSTILWAGRAATVTAVEPGDDMRAIAARRLGLTAGSPADSAGQDAGPTTFAVTAGSAEATGLPDNCADIVTASQAMHWFDADRALPEIVRILRPGGVFAAYDCDWPPCVDWEVDEAYRACEQQQFALETGRDVRPPYAAKEEHAGRMRASGLFRFVTEIAVHHREEGDAGRLVALIRSQGGTVALLKEGLSEEELGLTRLREVAGRRIPGPVPFWWTYRIRLAVR